MTSPRHHLDPATVISHAAGALPPEMAAIVAIHCEACPECSRRLAHAEDIGGALIELQRPELAPARKVQLRAEMLERLEHTGLPAHLPGQEAPPPDPDRLPAALHPYFGSSYRRLKWRWMGPGMRYIRTTGPSGCTMLMLRIGPGKSMPMHTHGGSEITQILQGAYDDALGHFGVGDIADLDAETEHQPVTSPGVPCICVAALDAPLRFPGWLARTLQPVFGI